MGNSNSKAGKEDEMMARRQQIANDPYYMPGVEYTSANNGLQGNDKQRAIAKAQAIMRPCRLRNAAAYSVPQLSDLALRDNGWTKLPHKVPVRVTIAGFGTGATQYWRLNDKTGIAEYAVHQLDPMRPQNDIVWKLHLVPAEVFIPGCNGVKESVIRRLKYAVMGFLPSENLVRFMGDEDDAFPIKYEQVLRITDPDIRAALSAFEADYPTAIGGLMFKEVETPKFQSDAPQFGNNPADDYEQLANPDDASKVAEMWKKTRECLLPKPLPPANTMVPIVGIVPDCSKNQDIPNALGGPSYRRAVLCDPQIPGCGFNDVSPMVAMAASSETDTSGLAYKSQPQPQKSQQPMLPPGMRPIGSEFSNGQNFSAISQQQQQVSDSPCSGLTEQFFTCGGKKYPIYGY